MTRAAPAGRESRSHPFPGAYAAPSTVFFGASPSLERGPRRKAITAAGHSSLCNAMRPPLTRSCRGDQREDLPIWSPSRNPIPPVPPRVLPPSARRQLMQVTFAGQGPRVALLTPAFGWSGIGGAPYEDEGIFEPRTEGLYWVPASARARETALVQNMLHSQAEAQDCRGGIRYSGCVGSQQHGGLTSTACTKYQVPIFTPPRNSPRMFTIYLHPDKVSLRYINH
jgi:hypothetical protein